MLVGFVFSLDLRRASAIDSALVSREGWWRVTLTSAWCLAGGDSRRCLPGGFCVVHPHGVCRAWVSSCVGSSVLIRRVRVFNNGVLGSESSMASYLPWFGCILLVLLRSRLPRVPLLTRLSRRPVNESTCPVFGVIYAFQISACRDCSSRVRQFSGSQELSMASSLSPIGHWKCVDLGGLHGLSATSRH
ncbi:Uncharacterized protein Rs2_47075 [Raphanus sativus]|nr:Uncharacterized protein Rs2_47075 [Raphanus sativus]